jgi:hypothetical protein
MVVGEWQGLLARYYKKYRSASSQDQTIGQPELEDQDECN